MDTNSQIAQLSDNELDNLLDKEEKNNETIIANNEKIILEIDKIIASMNESVNDINRICNGLNQAEKNAGNQIDKLILKEAELWVDNDKDSEIKQ